MNITEIVDQALSHLDSLSEEELKKLFISCGFPVKEKEDYKRSCSKCGSFDFSCSYHKSTIDFKANVRDEAAIRLLLDNIESEIDDNNKLVIYCKNCGEVIHTYRNTANGFKAAIEDFFYG